LVPLLGSDRYLACARLYFERVQRDPKYPWSGSLIELLSALPSEQVYPLLRRQWSNVALRDELVLVLSRKPEASDRDKFVAGLSSGQSDVLRASMSALLQVPRPATSGALTPALRLLRRLLNQPQEQAARAQLLALLTLETGQPFKVREPAADLESLKRAYQPVFTWFAQRRPALLRQLDDNADDPVVWEMKLKSVPWDRGDPRRGEVLFSQRGCQTCHAGSAQLGPDLGGVTSRFSVSDLFAAIVFPNRDIAPRYRLTTFYTRGGQPYTGLVTFESADGVLVQTSASTTVRLADRDILTRQPSDVSLMPSGLLTGLNHQALADLYSYLETLSPIITRVSP
jgi:putative heme-binding domain-containing protein